MGSFYYAHLRCAVRPGILLAIAVVAVLGKAVLLRDVAGMIFYSAFARLVRGNTPVFKTADVY